MLLTRAVRPDRLIIAAKHFVQSVFGDGFVQKAEALLHLDEIINNEVGDDRTLSIATVLFETDSRINADSSLLRSWPRCLESR